jgi:UDP-glucose:(heptosyl)LPS alpha-1,3-glucosyltransferase
MRIGLVIERFDPARGGREQWTHAFARRLVELGHEVHVASRSFAEMVQRLPIVCHEIQCDPEAMSFANSVEKVLSPLLLDIVHDMGTGWYCDVFHPHGGSQASVAERKLLFLPRWLRWLKRHMNGLLPRHRKFAALMARQYADRGQIVLALSRASLADFHRYHSLSADRVRLVHNGVDTERFSPLRCSELRGPTRATLPVTDKTVVALIVAHNFQLKGVATLLAAMRELRREGHDVHLVIVGGKRIEPWKRKAARWGLQDAVTFAGRVGDPLPYYAAADLYVHPTYYDPCSLVVLEAAACGLPIITSLFNGAGELFTNGREMFLLDDPSDAGELALAMRRMLPATVRARMGTAARATALQNTFRHNVDRILEIYNEIATQKGTRSVFTSQSSVRHTKLLELASLKTEN